MINNSLWRIKKHSEAAIINPLTNIDTNKSSTHDNTLVITSEDKDEVESDTNLKSKEDGQVVHPKLISKNLKLLWRKYWIKQ